MSPSLPFLLSWPRVSSSHPPPAPPFLISETLGVARGGRFYVWLLGDNDSSKLYNRKHYSIGVCRLIQGLISSHNVAILTRGSGRWVNYRATDFLPTTPGNRSLMRHTEDVCFLAEFGGICSLPMRQVTSSPLT